MITGLALTGLQLLLVRLALNLLALCVLVFGIYHRRQRRPEHVFSHVVINLVTFLLCVTSQGASIQLGFALGLFAVFGILRYRTESIPIRDLSYLFAAIGLAIFNGLPPATADLWQLVLVDFVLVAAIALLEASGWAGGGQQTLVYDNIALLAPGREPELHLDLRTRTGLAVTAVRVDRLDLLRESAELTLYYRR